MKKLSLERLADAVYARRKAKHLTQNELAELVGMNRSVLSRLESVAYTPSIEQLQALAEVLDFDPTAFFVADTGKADYHSLMLLL